MNLALSYADQAFAEEVRLFLDEALTPELRAAEARNPATFCEVSAIAAWHDILSRKGWVAPNWPREFGGPGWTVTQRFIFARECERAGAPRTFTFGLAMCGPVLMRYGTKAQQDHFLPRILDGADIWCQGYSEPSAGSDLASLRTRAVREGDHYVVTGSKIWTTFAHHANWIFALVRTDPDAKPQRGISFLLIDLKSPGISLRPIVNMAGDHEFNEVFFDDVRVAISNRVGDENDGWSVAKYLLEFERGADYATRAAAMLGKVKQVAHVTNALTDDFARKLSVAEADVLALEMIELRAMSAISLGQSVGTTASMLKLKGSELIQRIDELGLEALGPYASPDQARAGLGHNQFAPVGPEEGYAVTARYLYDRSITIYGGTSEVQRNILARAMLGL